MKKYLAMPELLRTSGGYVGWKGRAGIVARPEDLAASPTKLFWRGRRQVTGFTLIELLVTISLITVMLTLVLPVSYSTYKNYQESLEAEKVLMFLSSMKRESFLYSKEKLIETKAGNLIVDGKEKQFKGIHLYTEKPITFYKNGTNSGGTIQLEQERNVYLISIQTPLGDLKLTRE